MGAQVPRLYRRCRPPAAAATAVVLTIAAGSPGVADAGQVAADVPAVSAAGQAASGVPVAAIAGQRAAGVPGVVVAGQGVAGAARTVSMPAERAAVMPEVTPAVTRVPLGDAEQPAPGVTVAEGVPGVRTLSVTRTPVPVFSALGVTWAAGPGVAAVTVAVRVRVAGAWRAWRTLSDPPDEAPPAAERQRGTRSGTELAWMGPADGAEIAVTIAAGHSPTAIVADLIDPRNVVADATAGLDPSRSAQTSQLTQASQAAQASALTKASRAAQASQASRPAIISRSAWGVDERLTTWPPRYLRPEGGIVLRELDLTGRDAAAYAQSEVPRMLRALHWYQAVGRGWGDLGYAVVIDRFGRIWQGRGGDLARSVAGVGPEGAEKPLERVAVLGGGSSGEDRPATDEAITRYLTWRLSLRRPLDPVALSASVDLSAPGSPSLPAVRRRVQDALTEYAERVSSRRMIAIWRPGSGQWWIAGGSSPVLAGGPGDVPVPADYDGDGVTDPANWSPGSGVWRYVGSATGATSEIRPAGGGGGAAAGARPVPADLDGDGRAEPITWNAATGVWSLPDGTSVQWGQSGDVPLPADYDGDGRADLAVWRSETGRWYVRGLDAIWLGSAWHVPVPADYDGDGAVEPACWSPISHRWFVYGAEPVEFGQDGDVPAPMGYDVGGDGTADPAVLRVEGTSVTWRTAKSGLVWTGTVGEVPVSIGGTR